MDRRFAPPLPGALNDSQVVCRVWIGCRVFWMRNVRTVAGAVDGVAVCRGSRTPAPMAAPIHINALAFFAVVYVLVVR